MEQEIFNFFSHDEKFINEKLDEGNVLCMVMNKNLPPQAIGQGADYGYVLTAQYQNEERLVVAGGCYKKPVKRFDRPDPEILRKCSKTKKLTEGIYPIRVFEKRLEEPLCILLNDSLSDEQLNMFKQGYETFEIEQENKKHTAIACVYFDPNYETKGKIIAQWYN